METAMLDVVVVVVVSEDGLVTASVQEECRLIQKRQHAEWLRQIREDKKLWTLKTIRTQVPMPVQYEEQMTPNALAQADAACGVSPGAMG